MNPPKEKDLLTGDSRLIITAGSDTTASALTYTLYYLAIDPTVASRIRFELIANKVLCAADVHPVKLHRALYLNAVIKESLRMHPPVPSGVFRNAPSSGIQCGDYFIPGDVTILTPTYALQRSAKAYKYPDSFIPERWTTSPELILRKDAFITFAAGAYACIGKQLAWMELRTVLAKLVLEFDIKFAPGEDGSALMNDTKDCFTLCMAPLNISFVKRV